VDEAHHRRSPLARAQAAGEEPVLPPQRDGSDAVLHPVVVDGQVSVIEVAGQCRPALEAVVDGPGGGRAIRHALPLLPQPLVQCIGQWPGRLAGFKPGLAVGAGSCSLHLVKLAEELQRLLADLAAVVGPELMELAPGVRHAADLGHAQLEASLVAGEVVTDELALPS